MPVNVKAPYRIGSAKNLQVQTPQYEETLTDRAIKRINPSLGSAKLAPVQKESMLKMMPKYMRTDTGMMKRPSGTIRKVVPRKKTPILES